MRSLRVGSLQWVVGAYCCFLGAILLIAPRGFDHAILTAFQSRVWLFGAGLLIAGVSLFAAAILIPSRPATTSAHFAAGILLFLIGIIDARGSDWLFAIDNLSLSLAMILSGIIYDPGPPNPPVRINLATLLVGEVSLLTGLLLLAFPASAMAAVSPAVWDYLPVFGVLFVASAWLLFFVLLPFQKPSAAGSRWPGVGWLAYLAAGVVWLIFDAWAIAPVSSWPDIAFYILIGIYLIFYPWLVSASTFPFRVSLHARITLLLGVSVALPLIATVAWTAQQEESLTKNRVLAELESESSSLAGGANDYINQHQEAALAMAQAPDLLTMQPPAAVARLKAYQTAFPDMLAFTIYDYSGNPLGRSDQSQPLPAGNNPTFLSARRTLQPVSGLEISAAYRRPVFLFGAPILDANHGFAGLVLCEFNPTQISALLNPTGQEVEVRREIVDLPGHSIVRTDTDPLQLEAPPDFNGQPLAAALLAVRPPNGTLEFSQGGQSYLAGYSQISGLGWYLVSFEKEEDALAPVSKGRESALLVLLASLALAVLAGWWIAGKFTDTLAMISRAATALAMGDSREPLPNSRISELAALTNAFGGMRDRLAARTLEREKAEHELRISKDELEKRVEARTSELSAELEERGRIERDLKEVRNRFQLVLDHSPVLVFTSDTDLRYTWAYRPWSGIRQEDLLHHRDDEILPAEAAATLMKLKKDAISTGRGTRGEMRLALGPGEQIYDVAVEPVIDESGELTGLAIGAMDVTRQKNLEREMRRTSDQVEVQRRLIEHREQERLQIARDLHDGPLQELISLGYTIEAATRLAEDSEQAEALVSIRQSVQNSIEEIRAFASELRPPTLAKFGLARSIRSHAENVLEKNPDLHISLDLEENGQQLPEQIRLVLFRIYQESIQNILRHSGAKHAAVRLQQAPPRVILEIEDDGRGFEAPEDWLELARQGHLGLVGMRERAEAAGGNLVLRTAPGEGTWIHVQLPVEGMPDPPSEE